MSTKTPAYRSALLLLTILAAGCSGGGGEQRLDAPASPTDMLAYGAVTAFGSVFVNGVRYDTVDADFTIDGRPGTQADLAVGDVVLVAGSLDTGSTTLGTAETVVFDDAVEGPIGSIDLANDSLVVLGQTVRISAATSFDGSIPLGSLAGLSVGDIVEVSGFRSSTGSIEATRLQRRLLVPAPFELETTGIVSNLDSVGKRFNINALPVDYSAAMLQDFPSGAVANGDLVEVRGTNLGASGELIATRVELVGENVPGETGDRVEVEGFITRFVSATDFDVAGLGITTTSATVFEGGVAADLGLDIKVEAEGALSASGILVADKIDIRRAEAVRITALVDFVSLAASSFVTLGITVRIDSLTRMEDKSAADVERFTLADLNAGDYVEVRGTEFPAASGEVLAARVERDDPEARTELRGFIEVIAEPSFTILGVGVTTDGATVFTDETGTVISAAQFFAALSPGSLVEARGIEITDRTIAAARVELEDE
jgi:hypothetical protein